MHQDDEMVDSEGRRLVPRIGTKSLADLQSGTNDYVRNAANKLAAGEKLTRNETRRLGGLLKRDHFGAIESSPLRLSAAARTPTGSESSGGGRPPAPRIEDVENLEPKLRRLQSESEVGLTQEEFNAMLNVALGLDTRSELEDMAFDMALLAIEFWFSFYDETEIEVCGLGSVIFVTH